jgi:hypothetical protein
LPLLFLQSQNFCEQLQFYELRLFGPLPRGGLLRYELLPFGE